MMRDDFRARFAALRTMVAGHPSCSDEACREAWKTVTGMLALCDEALEQPTQDKTPKEPLVPERPYPGPLDVARETREQQRSQRFPEGMVGVPSLPATTMLTCTDCHELIRADHMRVHMEIAHQVGFWWAPGEAQPCSDCTDDAPCARAKALEGR